MALVLQSWELNVTLVDNGGNSSTLRFILVAADETAADTAVGTILTRLGAVSNAVVKQYTVGKRYVEDNITLPGSGVHVEDRAKIVMNIDGEPLKTVTTYIPAPKTGIFIGTSGEAADTIDASDADLQAYVATWHDGGLATISDGEKVAATPNSGIKKGGRTHRQSSFG